MWSELCVMLILSLCVHGYKLVLVCVHLSALHPVQRKCDPLW